MCGVSPGRRRTPSALAKTSLVSSMSSCEVGDVRDQDPAVVGVAFGPRVSREHGLEPVMGPG
ncbi:hypothetical protein [Streptomyces sp. NPDC058964]|uniref:hypothetical protein n=1 Tax=Streptomyces sp. NPDC058964 TaxID=3346681 RepID=UPI0036AFE005